MTSEQEPNSGDRARVDRQFRKELLLSDVEVPDWDLITRIVDLLRPYTNVDDPDAFEIQGRDARGTYGSADLVAFRKEYDERQQKLEMVVINGFGRDVHGYRTFSVQCTTQYSAASMQGGDEVLVNGLAASLETIWQPAAERLRVQQERQAAEEAAPEQITPLSTGSPIPARPNRSESVVNHPWTVTIVGGSIAAVIAGLVLYLLH